MCSTIQLGYEGMSPKSSHALLHRFTPLSFPPQSVATDADSSKSFVTHGPLWLENSLCTPLYLVIGHIYANRVRQSLFMRYCV